MPPSFSMTTSTGTAWAGGAEGAADPEVAGAGAFFLPWAMAVEAKAEQIKTASRAAERCTESSGGERSAYSRLIFLIMGPERWEDHPSRRSTPTCGRHTSWNRPTGYPIVTQWIGPVWWPRRQAPRCLACE